MFWKYKNLFIVLLVLVASVAGFYLTNPLDVGAQSACNYIPGEPESPPCYESAAYPSYCTGVNSTWCATNYGVVVCAQQFKDVKNRTIMQSTTNISSCPTKFEPTSCDAVTARQVSLGYISCQGVGACGNGVKETGECCDGGSSCDNTCRCTTGLGTCGDGFCTGQETDATCPNDCNPGDNPSIPSNTCTQMPYDYRYRGPSVLTVYQGGQASLDFEAKSNPGFGNQSINYSSTCLPGATCPGSTNLNVDTSEWTPGNVVITTNTSVTPGTYSVALRTVSNSNSGCAVNLQYTVVVKPSRKMVCDGGWYEIPPGSIPDINSGPLVRWNNGATNNDKYFKATYNGRYFTQYNQTTYANDNFSTKCVYSNGMSDTCTWDLPVVMPNTGAYGYLAVYGWPSNSGTMGSTASAVDSSNRTITLRRTGNKFEYSCTDVAPPPVAQCDGAWHYLFQGGATPSQPVGIYVGSSLDSQYRDAVVIAARENGGAGTTATLTSCKFNGTNTCTWDNSWYNGQGGTTGYAPNLSLGWSLDFNIKTTWAGGEWVKNINRLSGWSGWSNQGADNGVNWGQPFRTQDKLGRYWQFRNIGGSVAYACGATPVCVTLNYDSSKSSISKTNLASGEAFTVKCDYGVRGIDAVGVTTGGGATCAFSSWDSGNNNRTTANFNCTAGNVGGTFPISCTNVSGTSSNVCSQSNSLGNITVTAPALPTADISANPTTVPYNSASTISWTSTNATSCAVSCSNPPGSANCNWTGTSGNRSSGALPSSATFSLTCTSASGLNSTDSVTVNVQVPNQYILNVVRSGQGTVTSSPSGINCGSTCSASFVQNTNVVLTATPANGRGRIFTGWTVQGGGSCAGTGTCTVTMNSGKTVTANFALNPNFIEF